MIVNIERQLFNLRQLFEVICHPEWFIWQRTNWWQWGLIATLMCALSYGSMALRTSSPSAPSSPASQSIPR